MEHVRASSDGYSLAYREARRSIEDQERTIFELRSWASGLIAAATVATSFFGGQTLVRKPVGTTAWVAIGCFVLLSFAVLLVLWPRRDLRLSVAPDRFIATYLEPAEGEPIASHLIERDLALHMSHSSELNRLQLRTLARVFRLAAILLVFEVLAWVAAFVVQR